MILGLTKGARITYSHTIIFLTKELLQWICFDFRITVKCEWFDKNLQIKQINRYPSTPYIHLGKLWRLVIIIFKLNYDLNKKLKFSIWIYILTRIY